MSVKKICEKKIGDITYELCFFEGDNKYVIYKCDKKKMKNGKCCRIPEVGVFNNKEDAREHLTKLRE